MRRREGVLGRLTEDQVSMLLGIYANGFAVCCEGEGIAPTVDVGGAVRRAGHVRIVDLGIARRSRDHRELAEYAYEGLGCSVSPVEQHHPWYFWSLVSDLGASR